MPSASRLRLPNSQPAPQVRIHAPMIPEGIEATHSPTLDRLSEKMAQLRAAQPLPEPFVESLEHKLSIELTHGSTAIEGNTLTLRETQLLIDEGITPTGPKQLREIHETVNHHEAVLKVRQWVKEGTPLDDPMIRAIHRLIMRNIDDTRGGVYRTDRVMVAGAPRQPIRPDLIPEAMVEWQFEVMSARENPVVVAAAAHYRFVKIHPFYDGNGRTGRLLMNWILLAQGYPLTVIASEDRARYIGSLDKADRENPVPYYELIAECVERSLDQYLTHDS
ncbi:MAG: Fic family protein [Verrucomicrobiae bacterium]|nr:Fic family protein [Verrucomicrobiae bacterium]